MTPSLIREFVEEETVRCSICHEWFKRDINRKGGRLISCPAHSFGEVREEDYTAAEIVPKENKKVLTKH